VEAKPSSSPIVTVTRGARERILYEFTPAGRRELQGVASETGVSQVIAKPQ
jgi:DNA-binding PadR family transcriptional regulator